MADFFEIVKHVTGTHNSQWLIARDKHSGEYYILVDDDDRDTEDGPYETIEDAVRNIPR